jgi:hypothetical protein
MREDDIMKVKTYRKKSEMTRIPRIKTLALPPLLLWALQYHSGSKLEISKEGHKQEKPCQTVVAQMRIEVDKESL